MAKKKKGSAESLREQTLEDLQVILEEAKRDLFNYRVQATTKELTNPNLIKVKRREIARINTIITQKIKDARSAGAAV